MKKHFFRILLFVCGISLFTSCMKDDPKKNKTIYYAYQQIPNINDYMPQNLLTAFGADSLYFGDEPPRLEGTYIVDSIVCVKCFLSPGSNWAGSLGWLGGKYSFVFKEQHKGIAELDFSKYDIDVNGSTVYDQKSSTDTLSSFLKGKLDRFFNDAQCPVYFRDNKDDLDVFDKVYIMGNDPYFTIYYYDVKSYFQPGAQNYNVYNPLTANIISGKIETDPVTHKNVIRDFRLGSETVMYLNKAAIPTFIYDLTVFTKEGDGKIFETYLDYVHQREN